MYIVSACLIGEKCKYNGDDNFSESVIAFLKDKKYVMICPEVLGGLSVPRHPAEIFGDAVIDVEGNDVTSYFVRGTLLSLARAVAAAEKENDDIEGAVLKANSPSCGSGSIYDGTFSGNLISGDGIFAGQLKKKNIKVMTEKDIEEIVND